MKKILVPTDFSAQAENALKIAATMAARNGGQIHLHHSAEIPLHLATNGDTRNLPEALYFIKLAEKQFSELLKKPYLQDISIHETIGHSEIYDDIKEAVRKNDIDLIVMGSHGSSGFREMFIGSNTEKVVRTSEIPVLVIKNDHKNFEVKDFVFATDFSEECRKPFMEAQKFAKAMGAHMHLLLINTPSGFKTTAEAREIMEKFVRGTAAENYSLNIYNDISVEKGILNFSKEINAQLIGMSTHGRKGLSHFFNGSISEDMVNHANMPVITFKI